MEHSSASSRSRSRQSLQRSVSQHSHASARSNRSATARTPKSHKLSNTEQADSVASSITTSDKSLVSFPSISPESPRIDRTNNDDDVGQGSTQHAASTTDPTQKSRNRVNTIIDTLTGPGSPQSALFEDTLLTQQVPGALHRADDGTIERLIARHGAVKLVRQIAEDLAQRDDQIAVQRRKAGERERALRHILRECGLSNLDVETKLRTVEKEMQTSSLAKQRQDPGLNDLMNDAMQNNISSASAYGDFEYNSSTIRAGSVTPARSTSGEYVSKSDLLKSQGTTRGWKDYLWGTSTPKKKPNRKGLPGHATVGANTYVRSHSTSNRRPALQDDLFKPHASTPPSRSSSRVSSVSGMDHVDGRGSLASMALRLVAGDAFSGRETEPRGRTGSSGSTKVLSTRAASTAGLRTPARRATSVAGGPKALMAMKRTTPVPAPTNVKSQAQEMWETMLGSPTEARDPSRQESYGPVEMDAILDPETQPPTLTHIYNNYPNKEFLTDRFGFIYDQRRKRRQREAAQTARHLRADSRTEMLTSNRANMSPNLLEEIPSPKFSSANGVRSESPTSLEERTTEERPSRWQDYLRAATFPTELLSHTPGMGAGALEVTEGPETPAAEEQAAENTRPPSVTTTGSGLIPTASTTTAAIDCQQSRSTEPEDSQGRDAKEDAEPVKLLLEQLSDVHDVLQREKTVRWNDFLRKVRAERKKDGEAAIAAATAAAEARFERPTMILPETRVADGEFIGISNLGSKGKVGRAKWSEFKNLVLGGIPVAYRAKVWSECSGAMALRVPGYYDDLVAQSGADDDAAVVSQIGMDIHRTLTDNIFFRQGPGVQKLNEVLLAYARRNKEVGYCQGMNLIVANLLLIMPSAEDTFWVLASIVENILPDGYYDQSLISSRADQQVLRQYVTTVLPRLSAHLDALSIELEALTFQWFLSVFTDCLSAEALFRVWDVVLCTNDGSTFLFQVALALLKLNEGNLLQKNTPAGVYTYISHHMTEHAISIDGLMQASEGLRKLVKREDVEQRRGKAVSAEKAMLEESARLAREHEERRAKKRRDGQKQGLEDEMMLTIAEPQPIED